MHPSEYVGYSSLNIYTNEKYVEQIFSRKIKHTFYAQYTFSLILVVFQMLK
jgi:hypothetical protein